jgi:hypothetical protein
VISRTVEVLLGIRGIVNDEDTTKAVTVLGSYVLVRKVAGSEREMRTEMTVVPEGS